MATSSPPSSAAVLPQPLLTPEDAGDDERAPTISKTSWRFFAWKVVGGKYHWWPSTFFQIFIMTLIFMNVALVIIDSDPFFDTGRGTVFERWFINFEICSVVVFTVEYGVRLWCCIEHPATKSRLRWMLSPLALIDLCCLVPYILDLSMPNNTQARGATLVRLLRTFSLLRMERSFKSFRRIAKVLAAKSEELIVSFFLMMLMLIVSSSLMYYVENPDGIGYTPNGTKYTSIGSAMWWSVAALTTTGYGDITPQTTMGKLLGGIVAFLGLLFFGLGSGIISSGFNDAMVEERMRQSAKDRTRAHWQTARAHWQTAAQGHLGDEVAGMYDDHGRGHGQLSATSTSSTAMPWGGGRSPTASVSGGYPSGGPAGGINGGECAPAVHPMRHTFSGASMSRPSSMQGYATDAAPARRFSAGEAAEGGARGTITRGRDEDGGTEALVLQQVLHALTRGLPTLATSIVEERLEALRELHQRVGAEDVVV